MIETKFSKILVPIDGSTYSKHAADYGINIAKKFNSELTILYVVYSPLGYEYSNLIGLATPSQIDLVIENARKEAQKWFDEILKPVESDDRLKIKTEVVTSSISVLATILEYSEKEKTDLIVLGTKGRTGLKKLLLGSTAEGVVTYAHCPVMVVK